MTGDLTRLMLGTAINRRKGTVLVTGIGGAFVAQRFWLGAYETRTLMDALAMFALISVREGGGGNSSQGMLRQPSEASPVGTKTYDQFSYLLEDTFAIPAASIGSLRELTRKHYLATRNSV